MFCSPQCLTARHSSKSKANYAVYGGVSQAGKEPNSCFSVPVCISERLKTYPISVNAGHNCRIIAGSTLKRKRKMVCYSEYSRGRILDDSRKFTINFFE